MKVAVIMPAFNVSKWIVNVVNDVLPLADLVVVVDDGSKDDTAKLAAEAGAITLKHVVNRGQGAALRTGTNWALEHGADVIVHFDSDGQFRAQDIERVVALIKSGEADIVFGSRFLDKTTNMPIFKQIVIMPLARLVNKVLYNVKLTDPQSGFRAFNFVVGKSISWRQDRMAHASEILGLFNSGEWRVQEVPITVIYHDNGQSLSGGFKILKEIFLKKLI